MRAAFRVCVSGIALLGLGACANQQAPVASAQPCPPFVDHPEDSHANTASPYGGCTNRVNLEEMLEDKHDLAAGRALGPANGEREAKAVKDYEEGKTKTSPTSGASAGTGFLLQGAGATGTTQQ